MSISTFSIPLALCSLAATAAAQNHLASFDSVPEGILGATYSEDGIQFSHLDRYLGSTNELFVAEDASGSLSGSPGFTTPNTLGFGGWAPGAGAAYSRCGSFDITLPPAIYDHVELALFVAGTGSAGNTITLEARLGGGFVISESHFISSAGFYATQLTIDGEDFDSLRVMGAGPQNSGAFFALIDGVLVRGSGPLGTNFCLGTGGTPCPCGNSAGGAAGCANSTSNGAELAPSGSASLAANDLAFQAGNLPASQPALLFAGTTSVNGGSGLPFGDGLRCVGGVVQRLGTHTATVLGDANWDPGLLAGHGWNVGTTVRFQCWYRDPNGPCGSGWNLSNGVAINVQP